MTPIILYSCFVLLMYALASCDKECLCHFSDVGSPQANVEIEVDWSCFDKDKVSGMTVACYSDDAESVKRILTNDIAKAELRLPENTYDIIVFNQSESEFGSLRFSGMDSWHSAMANAMPYEGAHWLGSDPWVIAEPEWLAVGRMEKVAISREMIDESSGVACRCNNCCCEEFHASHACALGPVVPRCIIYTLEVRVNIEGIDNLKAARASISGLADSHCLTSGENGKTHATQILDSWRTSKTSPASGYIESAVRTLGLPSSDASLVFNLQLMLIDGKTIVKNSIDVTDLVLIDESRMSLSLELAIAEPLPDTKPSSGGGFEATVNGWTESEDIEIIL